MSLPRRIAAVHHRALERVSAEAATYRPHDSTEAIGLTLVPGRVDQREYDLDDEEITAQEQSWLILADDWNNKSPRPPEEGDEFDVEYPAGRRSFRVARGSEPRPWKFTDRHATQMRIQTVEVQAHSE